MGISLDWSASLKPLIMFNADSKTLQPSETMLDRQHSNKFT